MVNGVWKRIGGCRLTLIVQVVADLIDGGLQSGAQQIQMVGGGSDDCLGFLRL